MAEIAAPCKPRRGERGPVVLAAALPQVFCLGFGRLRALPAIRPQGWLRSAAAARIGRKLRSLFDTFFPVAAHSRPHCSSKVYCSSLSSLPFISSSFSVLVLFSNVASAVSESNSAAAPAPAVVAAAAVSESPSAASASSAASAAASAASAADPVMKDRRQEAAVVLALPNEIGPIRTDSDGD